MTKLTVADHPTPLGAVRMVVRGRRALRARVRRALGAARARTPPPLRCRRARAGSTHARRRPAWPARSTPTSPAIVGGLDALPVDPGGTPFQHAVWTALRGIPAGTTASYGGLARAIGHADAVRAVGAANGANPIWLVLPCHRVIGADGSLTGYAYGLERKRWLLTHEADAARSISPRTASVAPTPA